MLPLQKMSGGDLNISYQGPENVRRGLNISYQGTEYVRGDLNISYQGPEYVRGIKYFISGARIFQGA